MTAMNWGDSIRLTLAAVAVMTIALVAGGKPHGAANADPSTISTTILKHSGQAPAANGKRARAVDLDRPSGLEARTS